MLRPVPMMRLEAVFLRRDLRPALHGIAASGSVQLAPPGFVPEPTTSYPDSIRQEIAGGERLLSEVAVLTKDLEVPVLPLPASQAPPLPMDDAERRFRDIATEVGSLRRRRDELRTRKSRLAERLARLTPYHGVRWPLGPPRDDSRVCLLTGRLPASALPAALARLAGIALVQSFPPVAGRIPVLAATTSRHRETLVTALHGVGFRPETFTESGDESPDRLETRLQSELDDLDQQCRALDDAWLEAQARIGPRLVEIRHAAESARRYAEAERQLAGSPSLAVLSAWVPESSVSRVTARLRRETRGCCVARSLRPAPDEEVPVLLATARWLRPFQKLVEAYGHPRYREIVPTPFLALSYLVMFGLMFGDVGHGAVLAAAGLAIALRSRLPTRRDLGVLLTLLGISSLGFGSLYGSCFGIPSFKTHALWIDPVESDPRALMGLTLGWGVVLVSLGLGINIANQFVRGDTLRAVFGRAGFFGLLFYWGAGLALVLAWRRPPSDAALPAWTVAAIALPCIGWLVADTFRPHESGRPGHTSPAPGRIAALTESLVHAGEAIVAFLANTVSFLRLAAYAMSHAALLGAVWLIASEVSDAEIARSPAAWAVIVGGNLLVIVLEGTIAAVQALRLEYHEFFGRFFSGEGTPFRPLQLPSAP